jgi:thioredoxin reductase (NADPH)
MSVLETRSHQMFPVLDAGQIETARRFASGPALICMHHRRPR